MSEPEIFKSIRSEIESNDIVLFMKGSTKFPQCGFSSVVVHILKTAGVEFKDLNVLEDPALREGIKQYSDWPTIPQLYVKGEFIGGCDIIKEMAQSGELHTLFVEKGINIKAV
jgi:monothiol glutaredoxin